MDYVRTPQPAHPPAYAVTGVQINSALYLVMVFTAGVVTGHRWAWTGAVAAAGLTYLSYACQCGRVDTAAAAFNTLAILVAAGAGAALLF